MRHQNQSMMLRVKIAATPMTTGQPAHGAVGPQPGQVGVRDEILRHQLELAENRAVEEVGDALRRGAVRQRVIPVGGVDAAQDDFVVDVVDADGGHLHDERDDAKSDDQPLHRRQVDAASPARLCACA